MVTRASGALNPLSDSGSNVWVHYDATISAVTWIDLIDLSNTAVWPHSLTNAIHLGLVVIEIDRDASAFGSVELGVVTEISATQATVAEIHHMNFAKSDTRHIEHQVDLQPSVWRLEQSAAVLTKGLTSYSTSASLQNDTTIGGPGGNVIPGVGDLVCQFGWSAGSYDVEIFCLYHTE